MSALMFGKMPHWRQEENSKVGKNMMQIISAKSKKGETPYGVCVKVLGRGGMQSHLLKMLFFIKNIMAIFFQEMEIGYTGAAITKK